MADRLMAAALAQPAQGFTPNGAFAPPPGARPAPHALAGTLSVAEAPLHMEPASVAARPIWGRRVDRFPAVALDLVSIDGWLVPAQRGLLAPAGGDSFWHLIAGPGRVWEEPGDPGATRAAFPFSLAHPLENDTHSGVATFRFDGRAVSRLRFQVVQRTAPFMLPATFAAWGDAPATWDAQPAAALAPVAVAFAAERQGWLPVRPLAELPVAPALLAALRQGPTAATGVVHALAVDGTLYAEPMRADHVRADRGPFPHPEGLRHGVWSVTKSAVAALALLHLAQRYGDAIFQERIAAWLPAEGAPHDGWRDVTFADCLDMASGIGDHGPAAEPIDIMADYLNDPAEADGAAEPYHRWYREPSAAGKLRAAFSCGRYPWGPGRYARYRDHDLFTVTAAMDAVVRRREGTGLWPLLLAEVYNPIGIAHLPQAHTLEADGSPGVPLGAFGLHPTLDDLAKIAALFQASGMHGGRRLLSEAMTARVLGRAGPAPRPTGRRNAAGEVGYRMAWWYAPWRDAGGRVHRIPYMGGYGGNLVVLLPNGMTGLRIAHDTVANEDRFDPTLFARIAESVRV